MNEKDSLYALHRKDVVMRAEDLLLVLRSDENKKAYARTYENDSEALAQSIKMLQELIDLLRGMS